MVYLQVIEDNAFVKGLWKCVSTIPCGKKFSTTDESEARVDALHFKGR